jgi:hypothetical protein
MATTAATATQHQCSAVTVQTPPPAAGVDGTLVTAHQLLNNSSSVHASPSAAEQWCHDVDQLIVAAINTLHHEECDKSRRQRIRDPPLVCARTTICSRASSGTRTTEHCDDRPPRRVHPPPTNDDAGLWHRARHRQKRAPVSQRVLWHRARHPLGMGSGVATCPEAPCTPLARRVLRCCHLPRGTELVTW